VKGNFEARLIHRRDYPVSCFSGKVSIDSGSDTGIVAAGWLIKKQFYTPCKQKHANGNGAR
jgi:hypothetical protein